VAGGHFLQYWRDPQDQTQAEHARGMLDLHDVAQCTCWYHMMSPNVLSTTILYSTILYYTLLSTTCWTHTPSLPRPLSHTGQLGDDGRTLTLVLRSEEAGHNSANIAYMAPDRTEGTRWHKRLCELVR
jgi:hypothetical protein